MATERNITRNKFYGLNLRAKRYCNDLIKFFEATTANNVRVDPDNGIFVRKGREVQGTLAEIGHGVDWFVDQNNQEHLLLHAGTKIYDDGDVAGSAAVSLTGLTDGLQSVNDVFLGFFWFANGVDQNRKFDGSNWTRFGIPAPAAGPALADGGAGALTGTYDYIYVYYSSNAAIGYGAESRASDRSRLTVTAKQIDVSVAADPTGEADFIRVYRRSSNALDYQAVPLNAGSYELPNANATYTDNNTDAAVLLAGQAGRYLNEGEPLDDDLNPVNLAGVIEWKDHLWGWKGSFLYHTVKGRPGDWWNSESVEKPYLMDPRNNQDIVGAGYMENTLVFFTKEKMFLVVGDSDPYTVIDKEWSIGCIAAETIKSCGGYLMWLSIDGVMMFDGINKPRLVSRMINQDAEGYGRGLLDNSDFDLTQASAVYLGWKEQYWISLRENSSSYNKITWVFDFRVADTFDEELDDFVLSPWLPYDFGYANAVSIDNNRVVSVSGVDGNYRLEDFGDKDDGVDIANAYYDSRMTACGDFGKDKRMDLFSAYGEGSGGPIVFTTKVDILGYGPYNWPVTLTCTSDVWGADPPAAVTDEWGSDPGDTDYPDDFWVGAGDCYAHQNYPMEACGARIGFRVDMDKDAAFFGFTMRYFMIERDQA